MTYRRRQPGRPRRKRRSEPFLEKGLAAMVLGVGLWIASSLPTSNPMLKAVGHRMAALRGRGGKAVCAGGL